MAAVRRSIASTLASLAAAAWIVGPASAALAVTTGPHPTTPSVPAVATDLAALPSLDFARWLAVIDRLSLATPADHPLLLEALGSPERNVRTAAAHALSRIAGFRTQPCALAAAVELLESGARPASERAATLARLAGAAGRDRELGARCEIVASRARGPASLVPAR